MPDFLNTAKTKFNDLQSSLTFPYLASRLGSLLKISFAVCAIVIFTLHRKTPENELGQFVLHNFSAGGGIVFFAHIFYQILRATKIDINNLFKTVLNGLVWYTGIIFAIGEISLMASRNVAQTVCIVIVVLLLAFFYSRVANGSYSARRNNHARPGTLLHSLSRSESAREHTAAHEAGHALMYAAFPRLPEHQLSLTVLDKPAANGALGFVSCVHIFDDQTSSTLEWHMLLLLAGQRGELSYMGYHGIGGFSDINTWITHAQHYLSTKPDVLFFPQAVNEVERKHNEEQMLVLKAQQFALLDQFFELNKKVHKQLAELAFKNRQLRQDELEPFLLKVRFPPEFPRPVPARTIASKS